MKHRIQFTVNGEPYDLEVPSHYTLLRVLREQLVLTGTKNGCEAGECGACAVLMNGEPVNSCMVLAPEADGAEIMTIEGLAHDQQLDPLQEAFVATGATQCGFCTPGILVNARALLDRNPEPERRTRSARRWSATCAAARATCASSMRSRWRPGAAAGDAAAGGDRHDRRHPPTRQKTHVVGASPQRIEGREKVTGAATYVDDMQFGPEPAVGRAQAQPDRARPHQAHRRRARRGRCPACGSSCPARTSPAYRALPQGPAHLRARPRALLRRSRRGGRCRHAGDRRAGAGPDRGRVRGTARRLRPRVRRRRPKRRCIHPDLGDRTSACPFVFPQPGTNISNWLKVRKGDMEQGWAEARPGLRAQVPGAAHPARAAGDARLRRAAGRATARSRSGPPASRPSPSAT